MGGYGSGWQRGSRRTVDGSLQVHIGWLVRQCPIREGKWSKSLSWMFRGKEIGSIGYRLTRDTEKPTEILLSFARDGESCREPLNLTYQRMPKGGIKTYAICPYCQTRRLTLFISSRRSLACCRDCASLTYYSSQSRTRYSGDFAFFDALLREERRQERKWEAQERVNQKAREWRMRKSVSPD